MRLSISTKKGYGKILSISSPPFWIMLEKNTPGVTLVSHISYNPLPRSFLYALPTVLQPCRFFRQHFFGTSCGLFTPFELPYRKGRSPPEGAPSKCSRGSGKRRKKSPIFYFWGRGGGGGFVSYLEAGGSARGA